MRKVARLAIVRLHAQGRATRDHLTNSYYDTPDQRLAVAGVALRIRRIKKRFIQTVKTAGAVSAGMHTRNEWEWQIPKPVLDLGHCDAEPALASVFADTTLRAALQPLFTTDFWRTSWMLAFPDGSLVELAADYGQVSTPERSSPICELELELKAGSVQRLYEVAHAFAEVLPLHLENTSKAARGYALLAPPLPPLSYKAGVCKLKPADTVEEAFQVIVQHCLDHLHGNSPAVLHGEGPEGVHQMRVATRRLRSCLGLFRSVIPRAASEVVNAEVRWLSGELALAREWDVFLEDTLQVLAGHFPDNAPLTSLLSSAAEAQSHAYQTARAAVNSARYTRLLLGIGVWRTRCDWRVLVEPKRLRDLKRPVRWFAANLLARRHARVRQWGDDFLALSAEERHRLRILCKRLRYAGEFFAELYPEAMVRDYLRAVTQLQDILGTLNDAVVAQGLLTTLGVAPDDPAANLVLGWKSAMIEQHLAHFDSAWATFCNQQRFWE